MKKLIYLVLFIALVWFFFIRDDSVKLGPGVFAKDPPIQENVTSLKSFKYKGYTITPLAKFHIKAKVLSKKQYRWGREAELSPVDLALGWGRMSDEKVLSSIKISQSNRWYYWWSDNLPIPKREIETNSANMHLIPANDKVKSIIDDVCKGDIVEFSGFLVRVDAKDGWHWVSSLTRSDTGSNACELVWVEQFEIKKF